MFKNNSRGSWARQHTSSDSRDLPINRDSEMAELQSRCSTSTRSAGNYRYPHSPDDGCGEGRFYQSDQFDFLDLYDPF